MGRMLSRKNSGNKRIQDLFTSSIFTCKVHEQQKMEQLNGEFRDREKVVRGIKKDDSVIIDGYQLYHNFVRPHMSLDGKTPADVAGIEINGDNKWMTVIQNASKN